jgi:hypothetical protein
VGDWLRDLGTLRRVVSVEELLATIGSERFYVASFESVDGVEDLVLSVPGSVTVTVWRSPGAAEAAASSGAPNLVA